MVTARKTPAKVSVAKAIVPPVPVTKPAPVVAKTLVQTPGPRPASPAPIPAAPARVEPRAEKAVKAKKPKLVRDRFTLPKTEKAALAELKERSGKLGLPVKKSELLRAGIKAMAGMPDQLLLAALKAVPRVKADRPAKD